MKMTQNIEREIVLMLAVVQNLRVRRIIPTGNNIMGSRRLDLQVQNVVYKNNLQDTEVSTEIIFIINSNSV